MDRDGIVQNRINRVMEELPEFCQRFLNYCDVKLTKLTASSYLYAVRQFFCFYGNRKGVESTAFTIEDLGKITTADIEDWLATYRGKIDMNTIVYRHSVMKTFLGYYFTRGEISRNVTEQMLMPHLKEKPIIRLTSGEVTRLLEAVDTYGQRYNTSSVDNYEQKYRLRDKTILIFFLSTGVRISELVGLDIKHIDMENASFVVTRKGGKVETQYMTEDLQIQLMFYLDSIDTSDENAPLFSSRDNPRIADNTIRDMVKKYIAFAEIKKKITPHKLRSTFGTQLYRKTRDIFAVAQVLGHSSVNTTRKHYVAMDEDIKREAVSGFSIFRAAQ